MSDDNSNPEIDIHNTETETTGNRQQKRKPLPLPFKQSSIDRIVKILGRIHNSPSQFKKNEGRQTMAGQFKMNCYLWGETLLPETIWGYAFVILMPGIVALGRMLHDSWIGEIAYALVTIAALMSYLFLWPHLRRKYDIKNRTPEDEATFIYGVRRISPDLPTEFIQTARKALANTYNVPEELISYRDTKRKLSKLYFRSPPVAIEFLYSINVLGNMKMNIEELYELYSFYEISIPTSVPHLIGVAYKLMHEDCENA